MTSFSAAIGWVVSSVNSKRRRVAGVSADLPSGPVTCTVNLNWCQVRSILFETENFRFTDGHVLSGRNHEVQVATDGLLVTLHGSWHTSGGGSLIGGTEAIQVLVNIPS